MTHEEAADTPAAPRASSLAVLAAPLALLLADLFLDDGVVALLEPARHGQQILGVQVYLLRIPFFAAIPDSSCVRWRHSGCRSWPGAVVWPEHNLRSVTVVQAA
jgi:hypothetical protein